METLKDGGAKDTKLAIFKNVSTENLKSFRSQIDEEIARRDQDSPAGKDQKLSDMSASAFAAVVDKAVASNKSRAVYRGTPPRHPRSGQFKKT